MKKYLKNCRHLFPVYGNYERQYMKHLKKQILEYQSEAKTCSYNDLVSQFGSPVEIVTSYYDSIDEKYLLKRTNLIKLLRIFLIWLIGIIIIFFSYKSYILYQAYKDAKNTIIIYEETTIQENYE